MTSCNRDTSSEALREQLRPMWERIARAERQLSDESEVDGWYFALLGFDADFDEYRFGELGRVRRVEEPPDPMFLQFASDSPYAAAAVARYSREIRFELVVPRHAGWEDETSFELAWELLAAIRLSSLAELLMPAVSDCPWGTIPGIKDNRAHIRPIEDVPGAKVLTPGSTVTPEHLDWVKAHFMGFAKLLNVPTFRLASEALATHHLQHSDRMMAAHVWAGIEALIEVKAELRFRLSALIASVLEEPGVQRRGMFKKISKMYDQRSKIVHGANLSTKDIRVHTIEARTLLARLMRSYVQRGKVPTMEELELELFAPGTV